MLTDTQIERYSRQILLEQIGPGGQQTLLDSRVLVVGAGGLGSPVLLYLAAAGVGTLGVADADSVELSNLHRQILYGDSELGEMKVVSAARRLGQINPEVRVRAHAERVNEANALSIFREYDVVVDATDLLETKYLLNDAAWRAGRPLCHAGVSGWRGQVMMIVPGTTACCRCLFPVPSVTDRTPPCIRHGAVGPVVGTVGCLQATEVLRHLLRVEADAVGRLVTWDALGMRFHTVQTRRDPSCVLCGNDGAF